MQATPELVNRFRSSLSDTAKTLLRIRTKDARIIPLEFNRAQQILHSKIEAQRKKTGRVRAIVLKARQEGISTYVAARFFHRTMFSGNVEAVVVADEKKRAGKIFEIYDRFWQKLPEFLKPKKRYVQKQAHLIYQEPLSSAIQVETAKDAQAGRATTIQCLHASEMAFWENASTTFTSLMQAIPDSGSEVIIESTANGVGGEFYQLWRDAIAGNSAWVPIFLPWWIHEEYRVEPTDDERRDIEFSTDEFERRCLDSGIDYEGELHVLTVEQLGWRRRKIKDDFGGDSLTFRQEYPATWREAFLVSGNAFFDTDSLRAYEEVARTPERGNIVVHNYQVTYRAEERGYLRVWVKPSLESRYCIFADTAEGKAVASGRDVKGERGGTDFCSAHVLDVTNRAYVASLHGRMGPEVFAEMLFGLGYWYSGPKEGFRTQRWPALLAVERNHSSGQTVLKLLKEEFRYENLFYHRLTNKRVNKVTSELGWVTNGDTRPIMLDTLAIAFREESVSLWDAETIGECFTFVRGDDGKPQAQEDCHDDRVISAAGVLVVAQYVLGGSVRFTDSEPQLEKVGTSPTGWDNW